jgi:hypothetical protein
MHRRLIRFLFMLAVALLGLDSPAAAQIVNTDSQAPSFPVLARADYLIDRGGMRDHRLYRVADGMLWLRSTAAAALDTEAYCELPDRHWGPLSMVNCSLEVSDGWTFSGATLPSVISLAGLPLGSTVTLRLLAQAPLVLFDLQGSPFVVMDTFVEEYRWTLIENIVP